MSVYNRAASAVLDKLWEDSDFRAFFHKQGYSLSELGPLIPNVFVHAYRQVKQMLQGGALEMLEAQVTEDLLGPLYDQPHFREMWQAWDQPTRDAFLREQSEMQLGLLLVMVYDSELVTAFQNAFLQHLSKSTRSE